MSEPIVDQVVDPTPDVAPVVDPVVAPVVEPVVNPADTTTVTDPVKETPAAFADDLKYSEVKYGGLDVDITIPADIANFAAENGIDAEAVSRELYGSEDFSLTDETRTKLDEAFGKWQVDAYLSGLKAKNDAMVGTHNSDTEARTTAETAAWDNTMEIMGGEDKWADMSAYAVANLDAAEVEEFNEIMANGSLRMQQLMIKDVYSRFEAAGAPVAPTVLDLEEGGTGEDPGGGEGPMTAAAYLELLTSGKYKEDPVKYDKLRRAGIAKGL